MPKGLLFGSYSKNETVSQLRWLRVGQLWQDAVDETAEFFAEEVALLQRLPVPDQRPSWKRTVPEKVPLSQELEIVESYLAIEQIRFADSLRVEIKVWAGALGSLVPCFLLQPIVENAIRHGVARGENEGLVVASAPRDGNRLCLKVCNTGLMSGDSPRPGNGIGLKNTWERLAHFYQTRFEMNAAPLEEGGFQVAIAFPYEHC